MLPPFIIIFRFNQSVRAEKKKTTNKKMGQFDVIIVRKFIYAPSYSSVKEEKKRQQNYDQHILKYKHGCNMRMHSVK